MAKSRTQKAALNTTTAAISEVVMMICGLILPRLILANYGSAYNGVTQSAKQFLSAVSILNVGVAGSTRVALYKPLAEHDMEKCSAIVRATEKYMRKIGIVLAIYTLGLAALYPIFVETDYGWFDVAILIVAAAVGTFGQYFFGTAYTAFLSADQSVYISNIFTIISSILNTAVSIILIKLGCTIQVVKMGSALVLFMRPLMQNVYVTKRYNLDKKCKPDDRGLSKRRDVMAHSIANIVHDHTDMVVLTIFMGVKVVSVYTVYNLVMSSLKKMQTVFTSGTEAIYGNMWASGEEDKIRSSLGFYEYFVTVFISVIFSTSMVMILPFVSLYTRGVHDVEYVVPLYAFIITAAQAWFCMRSPYITLVQGVGHYKQTKIGAYFEAGINLISSIVLVQFVGMAGVAIGTLIANIFRTLQYAIYIDNNLVKRGKIVFVKRMAFAVLNMVVINLIVDPFVGRYATKGWLMWIACALAAVAISAVVTLISSFICYRQDMFMLYKVALRIIGRKKKKR